MSNKEHTNFSIFALIQFNFILHLECHERSVEPSVVACTRVKSILIKWMLHWLQVNCSTYR